MIRIHCTKKLLAKLPLQENGRLSGSKLVASDAANDEPESFFNGWHANLILLQRRQCVLFVHDQTRFPLFVFGLKKADFVQLDYWFIDSFVNTLLKANVPMKALEAAQTIRGPLVFDTVCDRSVQGSMNRMVQDLEHWLWYDNVPVMDLSAYRVGAKMADRPCTVKGLKGCIWPLDAMTKLLSSELRIPDAEKW